MKRAFLTLVCLLLMATCAYAASEVRWDPVDENSFGTANADVRSGRSKVHIFSMTGDSVGDVVALYDEATIVGMDGTEVPVLELEVGTAKSTAPPIVSDKGVLFKSGLVVVMDITQSATYTVVYDK